MLSSGEVDCIYKLPNLIENVGFDIYVNGIYEDSNIDLIVEHCRKSSCYIDIGANIGSIAIPVGKRLPGLHMLCVEASAKVYSYLDWNIRENQLENVKLFRKAVTDKDDSTVNFYSPDEKYGKGSMAPVFEKNAQSVETITLTKLIGGINLPDIGLIKVDVEGFEYFVFKGGCVPLEKESAPDILFEFVDWAEKQPVCNREMPNVFC